MSVVALTILNKVCKVRASGHACSCTMPYLLFSYFFGLRAVPVCVALYLAEFWASVRLKRHTVKEFILGSGTAAGVFAVLLIAGAAL